MTLGCGLAGAILLWAAFPPLDWPLLAWVAPLPWLWLVRLPQLPGQRPYLVLWLAGSVHWLLMLQGIRLAHPALYGGWLALSIYLGIYLPLFVGLTRVAVQKLKLSLVIAAPVVWVGLELLRGHLVTGFSNGLLAHTQAEIPLLIQISDLAGGYTLSFAIMLVAACLTRIVFPLAWGGCGSRSEPQPGNASLCWWPLIPILAALSATLAYGNWRLAQPKSTGPQAKVALIQGSLDTVFGEERLVETLEHYRALTARATAAQPNLDLVIWPESSFLARESLIEEPLAPLPNVPLPVERLRANLEDAQGEFLHLLAGEAARANAHTAAGPGTRLVVGSTSYVFGSAPTRMYNSALVADRDGQITCRYYKTHPVMFGEYIPFGEWLPWLYRITPIGLGLSRGDGPRVFEANGVTFAPNICFESTIPHLVRRHLVELRRRGTPADVIVNVSNDGWFWGSSILDLHFRSNILRAVENRKPLVVAANTGISSWIDGSGVVRSQSPRRTPDVLIAIAAADGRASPYHVIGDWPAWLCAAACAALALVGCGAIPVGRSHASPKTGDEARLRPTAAE
jgi:apolipoprotein N-acyltransferase